MSTLTWITEKELERKVKKTRRPVPLEEKQNNFIYNDGKKKGKVSGHQSENEQQRKKSEQELIKRVTRKFLEVSRCSREAKQRQ